MSHLETQLAPGFLVAAPALPDPNFAHSVVFLMEHSSSGAMGLVINRPLQLPLGRLLAEIGLERGKGMLQSVLFGGPVAPARGLVLHDADWGLDGTVIVAQGLALSSSREVLEAIVRGRGPRRFQVCLGYSGWGPMQLEGEIAGGSWIPLPVDPELVFGLPAAECWEAALRRNGIDPAMVSSRQAEA